DFLGGMIVGKQEFDGREAGLGGRLEAGEEWHVGEHHGKIGGETGHLLTSCYLSPGSFVPVTLAYIRATEASSSRPMPAADVIKNICSAAADTGTGKRAVRAMSWMMPRSLTKISTALRGVYSSSSTCGIRVWNIQDLQAEALIPPYTLSMLI